jgi:hypothetical protein
MSFFSNLFGPSIHEKVSPYFTIDSIPTHIRITNCVRDVLPTLNGPSDHDKFHAAVRSFLSQVDDNNEMNALYGAAFMRGVNLGSFNCCSIALIQVGSAKWETGILSEFKDTRGPFFGKRLLYGKFINTKHSFQMWMSLYDDEIPMVLPSNDERDQWIRVI